MGRAHHDGQQLEHLPETRLGEEHGRATGAPKLAVAQFGFGKESITVARAYHKESSCPSPLSLSPRFTY